MDTEQKVLLKKFIDGQCNDGELQQVNALLNDPAAKEFLRELMSEQAEMVEQDYLKTGENLDLKTEQWLKLVHEKIDAEQELSVSNLPKKTKWSVWRHAAVWAGMFIVASAAFWQIRHIANESRQIVYVEKSNVQGVPAKFVLPDSSEIFLGAGSKVRYPDNFKGDKREITLAGEAFFQVKHLTSKPFIIHTGEIQTQVLGTSFKVQAFKGQPLIVAVATGKVGVSELKNDRSKTLALLTPGLKLTWYSATGQAVRGRVDINNLNQWKNGDIVFEESPLGQVTSELERRYGITITYENKKMAEYRVSGSFSPDQSTATVLRILSVIGKFTYQTEDSKSFKIKQTE